VSHTSHGDRQSPKSTRTHSKHVLIIEFVSPKGTAVDGT